jgi:putative peptidoglycan lipid II flippase
MKKTALIVMMITIISKILGFGREIVLSYYYGASTISDAYIVSITIPSVIFGFIIIGLSAGYIPILTEVQNNNKEYLNKFTSNVINSLIIICTIIVAIGFVFTDELVFAFASGFDTRTLYLTKLFTRISLFSIYFTGISTILSGYLQVKNKFFITTLVGIPLNIIVIISIGLSTKTDITFLAYGFVLAWVMKTVIMIPWISKNDYKYSFFLDFKSEYIIKLGKNALPVILGISVNEINVLVDRTLASRISVGGISALNYASKLNGFIQGIFVLSIVTVMYPLMSNLFSKGDREGSKTLLRDIITGINLLIIPITIGAILFSNQVISILFERGAFDYKAVELTSLALIFYSTGMLGFGLREILTRTFYSMQDTKTPMINAAIGMTLNIILNIILSRYLGIGGLALATSIAATFTTILLFISLRKKIGPFGMKQISISFLKILFASSIMGLFAKLSFNYLTVSLSQNLSLLLAIGIGAVSYFVIIYFMKIEDVDVIVGAIKKKLGRGAA